MLLRHGNSLAVLPQLVAETEAQALYFNADYSPYAQRRDDALAARLSIPVHSFDDAMLHPPDEVLKKDSSPYVIFTPYKRVWWAAPKPEPERYSPKTEQFHTLHGLENEKLPTLKDLDFGETIDVPEAGEAAAVHRLNDFAERQIEGYGKGRDLLGVNPFTDKEAGTSGLSPYLRFGMISPRQA